MKKNFLYSLLAVFGMLFASCSQEEIVSTAGTGSNDGMVRLSVNLSNEDFYSRASQSLDVDGYVMRCICQAVNADGTLIEGFNEITSVTNGTASFEFDAPEGVANYLFWADYVEGNDYTASKSAFYKAEDLTKVGYRLNRNVNLFNNQAADAFCATVSASAIAGKVTLKRPFARLTVKQSMVEELGLTGLTNIVPTINAGTDFNVATGKTQTKTSVRLNDDETLTALTEGDFYFFCYAFAAPADQTTETTIQFTSATDATGKTLSIEAEDMQTLSSNVSVNLKKDENNPGGGDDSTINVDVEIDNGYSDEGGSEEPGTDPEPSTELAVGDYINAAGEKVTSASDAVAVVFALGAGANDTPAVYGESYASKTISAYAVALTNGNRGAFGNGDGTTAFPPLTPNDDFTSWAGYKRTAELEAMIGDFASVAFANYDAWVADNVLTGDNLSPWYIPSFKQLETFCNLTFGENADESFAAKLKDSFNTGDSEWFYISSTIRSSDNRFSAATITQNAGTCTFGSANPQPTTSTCIRAVVTIFE